MRVSIIMVVFMVAAISAEVSQELASIQQQIQLLQQQLSLIQQQKYHTHHTQPIQAQPIINTPLLPQFHSHQLSVLTKCVWETPHHHTQIIPTNNEVYLLLAHPLHQYTSIYDQHCRLINKIHGIATQQVLCDRGLCNSNTMYALTQQHTLIRLLSDRKFAHNTLANVSEDVVGSVVRQRGRERVEIFVAQSSGKISVYDEEGNLKLSIRTQSGDALSSMVDHHPYPLLLSQSGWISMLDTTKYQQVRQNCPYIPRVLRLLSDNYYSDTLYVIAEDRVVTLSVDHHKKSCSIKRDYPIGRKVKQIRSVNHFGGLVVINNFIYNTTSRQLNQWERCEMGYLQVVQTKQGQEYDGMAIANCCHQEDCRVEVLTFKRVNEDTSVLLWITVCFFGVLFAAVSIIRRSSGTAIDLANPIQLQRQQQMQRQIDQLAQQQPANKPPKRKKK